MTPHSQLLNLRGNFQQVHAKQQAWPERRFDGLPSTGAWRLVNGLKLVVHRSVGGISRWRQRRDAIRELQALSDRQLTDIWLHRSQIVSTVEKMIRAGDRAA